MTEPTYKIVRFEAENFKRLKAVEITPTGEIIELTGANAQGKSSIIDGIAATFGGASAVPPEPIHRGAKKGHVEIDVGAFRVRREFTTRGDRLKMIAADGTDIAKPQTELTRLCGGTLAFDPLSFMREKPAEQARILREMVGLDTTEMDAASKAAYDARTTVNRDLKSATARRDVIKVPAGAPESEVSASYLLQRIADARKANDERDRQFRRAGEIRQRMANLERDLERLAEELESITLGEPADTAALEDELTNLEARNRAARARVDADAIDNQIAALEAESKRYTDAIDDIAAKKKAMVEGASYPLPGLAVVDGVVTYNDLPLLQASQAEQLRVSTAIGMALNPRLHVMLINDGSLLDSTSLRMVAEMAKAADFQVWIERVDESGERGIVIEDGRVKQ